jgi:hypothetical protein
VGQDKECYKGDLVFLKIRIFFAKGLDRQISDLPVGWFRRVTERTKNSGDAAKAASGAFADLHASSTKAT